MTGPTVVFEDGRYNGRKPSEWVPDVVERIVQRFDPVKVVLFGSLARDEESRGSDIDLLVVLEHVDFERKHDLCVELMRETADIPAPVDFVVTDPEELERLGDIVGYIYRPALREGRVVYERRR